jgi:transposase
MNETLLNEVRRLWETEKLSQRQIAEQLGLGRRRVAAFLGGADRKPRAPAVVEPYERLIAEWYAATPSLKAIQVLKKLRSYGYPGGYTMVKLGTQTYRKKRPKAFHELEFLPGESAQVDWMEWKPFYGFVYVLAYSRYAVVRFYPRMTMEFFLDGHLRAFREIGGVAHQHTYDNLLC